MQRRTTQRMFLLRPGRDTRNLFGYMFVKAALDYGIVPHVASLMSNHFHAMVYDTYGIRSKFRQQALSNVARKRNLELDRRENLWATGDGKSDMAVLDMKKLVDQVLYICVQPVTAHLVERCGDWTGFQILPRDWGKPMRFRRPDRCGPDMPEYVEITPMPPPGFEHMPLQEVIDFFEEMIDHEERRIARRRKGPVLGIAVCEAQSPFRTPKSKSPMRTLNPRFTSSDRERILRAKQQLRDFNLWHRNALNRFRDGERDVVFPPGTIQMRYRAGVIRGVAAIDHPLHLDTQWPDILTSTWNTRLPWR